MMNRTPQPQADLSPDFDKMSSYFGAIAELVTAAQLTLHDLECLTTESFSKGGDARAYNALLRALRKLNVPTTGELRTVDQAIITSVSDREFFLK